MEYTKESLGRLVAAQKEYFAGGQTLDVSFRREMLERLRVDDLQELENRVKQLEQEKEEAVNTQDFERAASLRDEQKAIKEKLDEKKQRWEEPFFRGVDK